MKLKPSLGFGGNAIEVIAYYKEVFGMETMMLVKVKDIPKSIRDKLNMDDESVVHSELKFYNQKIVIKDLLKGKYKRPFGVAPLISLLIETKTGEQVDALHNRLVKDGGMSNLPPANGWWNARYAMVTDKFGVCWIFNHQKEFPKK